jgi:hypothetical protein
LTLNGSVVSSGAAQYQRLQIQEVLWLKLLPGPPAGWLQFDTHEIPYFPVDAVAHQASQPVTGAVYVNGRSYGQRYLELQAHPGW